MNPESYARLSQIVVDVMAIEEPAREAALVEACGGDGDLLKEARRMLGFMEPSSGVFSDDEIERRRESIDAALDSAANADGDSADEWLPDRIGSYEVVRLIGRGGTGVVFEARQTRPARRVAIKLLHPALASSGTVARLMREADVLGRLQHPGIAQIFEAGEFDVGAGLQPYIVMQLVDGIGLVDYVSAEELSPEVRVDILALVADAVAHAHEHGITHRDLKPDNILVKASDGQPVLLDFGVASMTTDDTLGQMTTDGQLLGTVAYMAPEQAKRSIGKISPATDVFALGAIAYEVMTGQRMRNVAGLSLTQALTELAAYEPPKIQPTQLGYRRDLGVIVGKAVETRPQDRYANAMELRADLRRYTGHRPIAARPPSAIDRSLKFARRNRALVAGLVTTALVLLGGMAATARQASIARSLQARAEKQLYAAEMRLATSGLHDPMRNSRLDEVLERWRPADEASPGWEWSLVDSVLPRGALRISLDEAPYGIAWEPSGSRIAVATETGLSVFDSDSGKEALRFDLEGDYSLILGVTWSERHPTRLFAYGVGIVFAWEMGASEPLWKRKVGFTSMLECTHDGHLLYVGDHHIYVVDADDGSIVRDRPMNLYTDGSGAISPDGRTVEIVPTHDSGVEQVLYSVDTLQPIASDNFNAARYLNFTRMRWSPDGKRIASGTYQGLLSIYGVDPLQELLRIEEFTEPVHGIDWHPDGSSVAAASDDRSIRVFDAESGERTHQFVGHRWRVSRVRYSPDGSRLASIADGGDLIVWSLEKSAALQKIRLENFGDRVEGGKLHWSEPLERIQCSFEDRFIHVTQDGALRLTGATTLGLGLASASGQWADRQEVDTGARFSEAASGAEVARWDRKLKDYLLVKRWHPSEPTLAIAVLDGLFLLSLSEEGQLSERRLGDLGHQVADLEWSNDGSRIVVCTMDATVRVFSAESGDVMYERKAESLVSTTCAAFSPDGRSLAVGDSDGVLTIHSIDQQAVTMALHGHVSQIENVAWSPDGTRIATAGRDRIIGLWNPFDGVQVASLQTEAQVSDVLWISGGSMLVALDLAGTVYSFDAGHSLGLRR